MSASTDIKSWKIKTNRLTIDLRSAGNPANTPLILLHGNLSSAIFWDRTICAFANQYHVIAPNMRAFGHTQPLEITACLGLDDMVDDVVSLTQEMGIDRYHLGGHSMGGGIAMKLIKKAADCLMSVILISTISPYGYSGSKDAWGTLCYADGAPAGAGTIAKDFISRLAQHDSSEEHVMSPMSVMRNMYFHPPFFPDDAPALLAGMLSCRIGDSWYPGNAVPSDNWPGFAPGDKGIVNAISSYYFNAADMINVDPKPPILWIRGDKDQIVSDHAVFDIANMGALGVVPGWPGYVHCPPQPMLKQTRRVLDDYRNKGGIYHEEVVVNSGHTPFIERADYTHQLMKNFLSQSTS